MIQFPDQPPPPWARDEFTRRRWARILEQVLARRNAHHDAHSPDRPRLYLVKPGQAPRGNCCGEWECCCPRGCRCRCVSCNCW